jgi:hypothetical protein
MEFALGVAQGECHVGVFVADLTDPAREFLDAGALGGGVAVSASLQPCGGPSALMPNTCISRLAAVTPIG